MQLTTLVNEINRLADEDEDIIEVTAWINDAIARINIELNTKFPFMDSTDGESEPVFPEEWQRTLLIPFGVGRLKQMDSSQFEYTDAYAEFMHNLRLMKMKYDIPEEFKNEDLQSSQTMELWRNPYAGGWL